MDERFVRSVTDRLQRERRVLIDELSRQQELSKKLAGDLQPEIVIPETTSVCACFLEALKERQQDRLGNIVANRSARSVSRRIQRPLSAVIALPKKRRDAAGQEEESAEGDPPPSGPLPPDLELMDDEELQDHLRALVSGDGQVDMHELQLIARNGAVYLEGALPSEAEHSILLNILTDVAGVQEIVDHLEIERLAWKREDRWKEEETQDVLPGTIPNQEPYGGTDDIVLADEEGVTYEPPENPPAPPHRKD